MSRMPESRKGRRPRRQFDEEFRSQAGRLVLDDGKTIGAVARNLDLTPSALRLWVRRAQADRTHGRTGLTTAEREELARLRKENRELRTERDILKKAAVNSADRRNVTEDDVTNAKSAANESGECGVVGRVGSEASRGARSPARLIVFQGPCFMCWPPMEASRRRVGADLDWR
jgi:transposase